MTAGGNTPGRSDGRSRLDQGGSPPQPRSHGSTSQPGSHGSPSQPGSHGSTSQPGSHGSPSQSPRRRSSPRPDLSHELALPGEARARLAGLDEAGRGALAGPVVAAAVILPLRRFDLARALEGVRDSKLMRPAERERWAAQIRRVAQASGLGSASAAEIDQLGLLPATRLAMARALAALDRAPTYLLIDHLALPEIDLPQQAITRGDRLVLSIAAASVLAKVARDRMMRELGGRHPGYGFAQHKGYGTAMHRSAIARLGPCAVHRRSYAPIRQALAAPD